MDNQHSSKTKVDVNLPEAFSVYTFNPAKGIPHLIKPSQLKPFKATESKTQNISEISFKYLKGGQWFL
jgi:hypothetical protein